MANIYVDVGELMRLSARSEALNIDIANTFDGIKSELNNISNAIKSNTLSGSNASLANELDFLMESIKTNLNGVKEFLDKQVQGYSVNVNNALDSLKVLIAKINSTSNFGEVKNSNYSVSSEKVKNNVNQDTETINSSIKGLKTSNSSINSNIDGYDTWDNVYAVYDFFKGKGFTDEQVSGILGNAYAESRFVLDAKNPSSTATGLFQWLEKRHPDGWTLNEQLEHAWKEIQTNYNGKILTKLQDSKTASDAANVFAKWFEGTGKDVNPTRVSYAEAFSDMLKSGNNG